MSAPDQGRGGAAGRPPTSGDDTRATARSLLVLGAAVLVGLVVYFAGLDQSSDLGASATSTTTTIVPLGPDRDAPPPTTTPDQAGTIPRPVVTSVPPAEVRVYVANAADPTQRLAGATADELTPEGYQIVGTNDAPLTAVSAVYYQEGFEAEARAVAELVGVPADSVKLLPQPPPLPAAAGADVLVMLGADRLEG